jgi:hypothetical protein
MIFNKNYGKIRIMLLRIIDIKETSVLYRIKELKKT